MIKSTLFFQLLSIGYLATCSSVSAGQPTVKELVAAPEKITIEGRSLLIETELWRDFMPSSPPDGRPLIAAIKLKTIDNTNLPKGIEVVSVWIVNDDKLWSPTKKEALKGDSNSSMTISVRDGPKWGPGIDVDVIVELKDSQNQSHLLRASKQPIGKTF